MSSTRELTNSLCIGRDLSAPHVEGSAAEDPESIGKQSVSAMTGLLRDRACFDSFRRTQRHERRQAQNRHNFRGSFLS